MRSLRLQPSSGAPSGSKGVGSRRAWLGVRRLDEFGGHRDVVRVDMFAAAEADRRGVDGSAAGGVAEGWQRLVPFEVAASPFSEGDDGWSEVGAFGSEDIFVAKRSVLILDPFQDAVFDEGVKTIGEDVGGDAQLSLYLGVSALSVEHTAQDPEGPHVTKKVEGAQDRASVRVFDIHQKQSTESLVTSKRLR